MYAVNSIGKRKCQNTAKNKKIFVKLVFVFITIVILSVLLTAAFSLITSGDNKTEYNHYVVKKGDSLWSIAVKHYGNEVDLRKMVYTIKKINNLDNPIISPGEKIIIPIN
ncbi:MAG: cell division suppressor protein YneA [Bacillota bacterium]